MRLLFYCFLLAATGCATITSNRFDQAILVRSEPPGAEIYSGRQKVGVTPAFVRIPRHRTPSIRLEYAGRPPQNVPLTTHYRWADSFGGNFVFLSFVFVGWAVDYFSDNAFDMDSPPPTVLMGKNRLKTSLPLPSKALSIAPPETDDVYLTQKLGEIVEQKLSTDKRWEVKSYKETEPIFKKYDSSYGLTDEEAQRNEIFYELKGSKVFISEVVDEKGKQQLKGYVYDPLTTAVSDSMSWDLDDKYHNEKKGYFFNRFNWVPNTFFINLTSEYMAFDIADQKYGSKFAKDESLTDKVLRYVNTIGLTYLERPRPNVGRHFRYNFFPAFNISRKHIVLNDIPAFGDIDLKRGYFSAGYGGEAAYVWRHSFIYFDFVPVANWTEIEYSSPVNSGKVSAVSLSYMLELGYTYFVSEHFVVKAFTRTVSENSDLWKKAFTNAGVTLPTETQVTSQMTGFSLGYYFTTALKRNK